MVPRWARRAAALALMVMVLGACPKAPAPVEPTTAPTLAPIRGGTIVLLATEDLDALDPHLAATPASWAVARALHRGLYAYPDVAGRTGRTPVPDLAAAEPVPDAGGMGARITLSPGNSFASGAPVTAGDVVASLRRLARADRGIGPALKRAMTDIVEVDGLVVHVTARESVERLVDLLAHPQAAVLQASTPALRTVRAPEGAGPYALAAEDGDRYVMRRRKDLPFDPVRPAHATTIEVHVGAVRQVDAVAVVLDPGPPDLVDPGMTEAGRVAVVSTGCVRYLDVSGSPAANGARAAVARGLRRLTEVGTGRRAETLVPRLLQEELPAPSGGSRLTGVMPAFDVVTSTSPRDRIEAAALRKALPKIRVRAVSPGALYGGAPVPAGARIRTWCADWPDVLAIRRSPAGAATALPLWWPNERVRLGARIRGFTGSPMFPRGDPTSLWLAPA